MILKINDFDIGFAFETLFWEISCQESWGRRGRDRMVVSTTYAISAYHHWVLRFPPPIKLTASI
jgi:hypothetical protein